MNIIITTLQMVQLRTRSLGPPSESLTGWGRNQRQVYPTLPSLKIFPEHRMVHCCPAWPFRALAASFSLVSLPWCSYFYPVWKKINLGGGNVGDGVKKASDSKGFTGDAKVLPTARPQDWATKLYLCWENKTQIELSCSRALIRYIPFDVSEVCCHGC